MRWEVLGAESDDASASLRARLDWDEEHPAFEIFPFPHRLEYGARVRRNSIEIAVALEPSGDTPVPVSFGFHPYLRIPAPTRQLARMHLPVRRRLVLGDTMIPTGATEPCEPGVRQLGDSTWDDGFAELESPPVFELGGGQPEVSVTFLRGYRFAQVFAPPGSDFVCFEPMTAPANALGAGGPDLPVVAPGERYETAFEIAAGGAQ
jgi:galactose mutarotase-like enzyme